MVYVDLTKGNVPPHVKGSVHLNGDNRKTAKIILKIENKYC